jgi:hypothetical protein
MPRVRPAATALTEETRELGTLDDLPQDPAPKRRGRPPGSPNRAKPAGNRGKIPARTADGKVMSNAQMVAKVKAELYTLAAMGVAIWDFQDHECASIMEEPTATGQDRLEAIIDHIVAMISRSPAVLKVLAGSGIIMDAGMFLAAVLPIAKRVWEHHGPNGIGHGDPVEKANQYAAQYPAYAGAVA